MECLEFLDRKFIKINEFNKKTINHLENNRFSIILHSEETDICKSYALYLLHWIMQEENKNKNVYIISHNYHKCLLVKEELVELSKRIFLKMENNSDKYIKYTNGVKVKLLKLHKHLHLQGETISFALCIDAAEAQNFVFMNFYRELLPSLSSQKDSKLVISSQPNGFNIFYKLFTDAEDEKNALKPLRLYYWEDGKKDGEWVKEKMKFAGDEVFNRRYNLIFTAVKGERKDLEF